MLLIVVNNWLYCYPGSTHTYRDSAVQCRTMLHLFSSLSMFVSMYVYLGFLHFCLSLCAFLSVLLCLCCETFVHVYFLLSILFVFFSSMFFLSTLFLCLYLLPFASVSLNACLSVCLCAFLCFFVCLCPLPVSFLSLSRSPLIIFYSRVLCSLFCYSDRCCLA